MKKNSFNLTAAATTRTTTAAAATRPTTLSSLHEDVACTVVYVHTVVATNKGLT